MAKREKERRGGWGRKKGENEKLVKWRKLLCKKNSSKN